MPVRTATVLRTTNQARIDDICASGLDWLMLDGEHEGIGADEIATMLVHIAGRLPSYVRVRTLDAIPIMHALAHGAHGIIVPNVETRVQAVESVRIVRTSPWRHARVVVQAESATGVENIGAIAAVPGIEWVLIGPNDLTRSLGIPGEFDAPTYDAAVRNIEAACRDAGLPVGIFGMTPDRVAPFIARGHTWAVVGIDRPARGLQ